MTRSSAHSARTTRASVRAAQRERLQARYSSDDDNEEEEEEDEEMEVVEQHEGDKMDVEEVKGEADDEVEEGEKEEDPVNPPCRKVRLTFTLDGRSVPIKVRNGTHETKGTPERVMYRPLPRVRRPLRIVLASEPVLRTHCELPLTPGNVLVASAPSSSPKVPAEQRRPETKQTRKDTARVRRAHPRNRKPRTPIKRELPPLEEGAEDANNHPPLELLRMAEAAVNAALSKYHPNSDTVKLSCSSSTPSQDPDSSLPPRVDHDACDSSEPKHTATQAQQSRAQARGRAMGVTRDVVDLTCD